MINTEKKEVNQIIKFLFLIYQARIHKDARRLQEANRSIQMAALETRYSPDSLSIL